MIAPIYTTILILQRAFTEKYGISPNVLLVSSNSEMDLNAVGVKLGHTLFNMIVVSAEIADDIKVALI